MCEGSPLTICPKWLKIYALSDPPASNNGPFFSKETSILFEILSQMFSQTSGNPKLKVEGFEK